jgi:uncharacterized RDD family membrane protein YckC
MEKDSILQKRVYAFTTDMAIVVATNAFLVSAFNQFIKTVFFHLPSKMQMFLIAKTSFMTSISLMSLTFAYFSLFYFLTNGKTMGKTFFQLKVINADKSEMTLKQSMLRSIAYFSCAFTGSFLFALSHIRKDEKSLADIFSGMSVVEDSKDLDSKEVFGEETGTEFELALKRSMQSKAAESLTDETKISEEEIEYFEQNKSA